MRHALFYKLRAEYSTSSCKFKIVLDALKQLSSGRRPSESSSNPGMAGWGPTRRQGEGCGWSRRLAPAGAGDGVAVGGVVVEPARGP